MQNPLPYLDVLVKALERVGSLALVAYVLVVWLPDQNRKLDGVALAQAEQAKVLERVVDVLDRIEHKGRP